MGDVGGLEEMRLAEVRGDFRSCFFFQAEDGIRDVAVTGVQTCALPISTEKSVYPRTQLCGKNVRDCEAKCEAWPDPAVVVCACVTKIDTVKNTVKRIRILFIGILPVFDSRQQLAGQKISVEFIE